MQFDIIKRIAIDLQNKYEILAHKANKEKRQADETLWLHRSWGATQLLNEIEKEYRKINGIPDSNKIE